MNVCVPPRSRGVTWDPGKSRTSLGGLYKVQGGRRRSLSFPIGPCCGNRRTRNSFYVFKGASGSFEYDRAFRVLSQEPGGSHGF